MQRGTLAFVSGSAIYGPNWFFNSHRRLHSLTLPVFSLVPESVDSGTARGRDLSNAKWRLCSADARD